MNFSVNYSWLEVIFRNCFSFSCWSLCCLFFFLDFNLLSWLSLFLLTRWLFFLCAGALSLTFLFFIFGKSEVLSIVLSFLSLRIDLLLYSILTSSTSLLLLDCEWPWSGSIYFTHRQLHTNSAFKKRACCSIANVFICSRKWSCRDNWATLLPKWYHYIFSPLVMSLDLIMCIVLDFVMV